MKSMAYSAPRQLEHVEVVGQTTSNLSFGNNQNVYSAHAKKVRTPLEHPTPIDSEAKNKQRELLILRLRQAIQAKGIRGLVNLKRQFRIMDANESGFLELVEFQQAIDDLKIPNLCESEVLMLFSAFDMDKSGAIDFHELMDVLIGPLSVNRQRLVQEAFKHLDVNGNGTLDLDEVKAKFDPSRHPDVKARTKTLEEARFEFYNLFTNLHSTNKNFKNDREVTLDDFMEYH